MKILFFIILIPYKVDSSGMEEQVPTLIGTPVLAYKF